MPVNAKDWRFGLGELLAHRVLAYAVFFMLAAVCFRTAYIGVRTKKVPSHASKCVCGKTADQNCNHSLTKRSAAAMDVFLHRDYAMPGLGESIA